MVRSMVGRAHPYVTERYCGTALFITQTLLDLRVWCSKLVKVDGRQELIGDTAECEAVPLTFAR